MSTVGRRGSSESGWGWSRPPREPRRPAPPLPLLPLAGGGLIVVVAIVLLAVWLSDEDDNPPAAASGTPTATATVAPPQSPSPTPTPALTASPSPTPTPPDEEPFLSLAVWNGTAWHFGPSPEGPAYSEGEAVPFLLRIDGARTGDTYPVTIRYDCNAFDFLTHYDRDHGSEPALAAEGPQTPISDSSAAIPDDPGTALDDAEVGSLTMWGSSFAGLTPILPDSACSGEKSFTVGLAAAADTVFLLWAAQISQGASQSDLPLRLTVQTPGEPDLSSDIDPRSVSPAQP